MECAKCFPLQWQSAIFSAIIDRDSLGNKKAKSLLAGHTLVKRV